MGFVSEAMQLMKINNYAAAAKLMESHLSDSDIKASAKIGIMSWIAECYSKSDDRQAAAKWFEQAGRAALACETISSADRAHQAREEFERAMILYEAVNDVKGMGRMATMKYGLKPSP